MVKIHRHHFTTTAAVYVGAPLAAADDQTLTWAVSAYAFLLPGRGVFTGQELAACIRRHYALTEPHNQAAYAILIRADQRPASP